MFKRTPENKKNQVLSKKRMDEEKLRVSLKNLDIWLMYKDIDQQTRLTGYRSKIAKFDAGQVF